MLVPVVCAVVGVAAAVSLLQGYHFGEASVPHSIQHGSSEVSLFASP